MPEDFLLSDEDQISEGCAAYLSRLLPGKPAFLPPFV
jgi:hypothetical protein